MNYLFHKTAIFRKKIVKYKTFFGGDMKQSRELALIPVGSIIEFEVKNYRVSPAEAGFSHTQLEEVIKVGGQWVPSLDMNNPLMKNDTMVYVVENAVNIP